MHHGHGVILRKCGIKCSAIQQITLHKGPIFHRVSPACRQIVEGHWHVARICQNLTGMGTDIASTPGDQNMLRQTLPIPEAKTLLSR